MTHSLSRAVGQRGRVQSFEYHEQRYKAARWVTRSDCADPRAEFSLHGLQNVHLEHGNVCKDGFNGHEGADASGSSCRTPLTLWCTTDGSLPGLARAMGGYSIREECLQREPTYASSPLTAARRDRAHMLLQPMPRTSAQDCCNFAC
jgi:hypothetical protein